MRGGPMACALVSVQSHRCHRLWPPRVQSDLLAAPRLGRCTSSGRAWRLRAARRFQEEVRPLGSPQPPPKTISLPLATQAELDGCRTMLELGSGTGWLGMMVARNAPAVERIYLSEMLQGGAFAWLQHNVRALR